MFHFLYAQKKGGMSLLEHVCLFEIRDTECIDDTIQLDAFFA